MISFIKKYLEAIIWILGILLMAASDPYESGHYSMCLIKNSGLGFCPGCGLGHSIGFLARGELMLSFKSHPLGIFAVLILSYRIVQIIINKPLKATTHEQNH